MDLIKSNGILIEIEPYIYNQCKTMIDESIRQGYTKEQILLSNNMLFKEAWLAKDTLKMKLLTICLLIILE